MVKVSIIMPVYNSEKYLSHAVNSILSQDFDDFELILVDDGSPDHSGQVCDDFAKKDARVKVIHKNNGGICSARNAGLDIAQGEYVGFCDNDDEYLPHLLKDNYQRAKSHDVDLMRYARIKRIIDENGKCWDTKSSLMEAYIDRSAFSKYFQNVRREDTVWTGLYKKSIIDQYHIRFDESFHYGYEDRMFNLQFLNHANKLGFNPKPYYLWSQRLTHSTSKTFHKQALYDDYKCLELEYVFMNGLEPIDNVVKNIFLTNAYIFLWIEYLSLPTCTLPKREKIAILDQFRHSPIFDDHIPKSTLNQVKKQNRRTWLTMKLFDEKKYGLLLFIVKNGTSLLSKFRFK